MQALDQGRNCYHESGVVLEGLGFFQGEKELKIG